MVSTHVHNCRRRMDDVGVVCAKKWLKEEKYSITKIAKLLHVSRSTVHRRLEGPLPSALSKAKRQPSAAVVARRKKVGVLLATKVTRTLPVPKRQPKQRGKLRKPREVVLLPFASPNAIARRLTSTGDSVSVSTVRRDLQALQLHARKRPCAPKFFEDDRKVRVAFARQFLSGPLGRKVLFSDEKYCDSNDNGCRWQWVAVGTAAEPRRYEAWAAKVHVWGVIGKGVKILVILPRGVRVNADVYVDKCIKPNLTTLRKRNCLLMQDGAPAHRAESTTAALKRLRVRVLPNWPPRSPDLNPIETVWAILSRRIADCGPTDIDELETFVLQEWGKISQDSIDRLVDDFERRLRDCIVGGGEIVKA
jgi:transposase